MLKNLMFLLLLTTIQVAFSQSEKMIHGRIFVSNATPKNVYVINLNNEKESLSNENGEFSILAKPGDVVVFSSIHLDYMRKIIDENDYNALQMLVTLTSKVMELDEVVVENYAGINAVDLGILSKPAKKYSVAERRLRSGTQGPVNKMANLFGNQKENLKRNIATEASATALSKLEGMFPDSFYTETLKIEASAIKAFHYFVIEDTAFIKIVHSNNKSLITFSMIDMAKKYVLLHQ